MPTDATLTKLESNAVFSLVQAHDLNMADFEWKSVESTEYELGSARHYSASQLYHRPTGYFFNFGGIRIERSPGNQKKVESVPHRFEWAEKLNLCAQWLSWVKSEVDAPDLWASVGHDRALSDAAGSSLDNAPFTSAEKLAITSNLNEIRVYLADNQQLHEEQFAHLDAQFQYLRSASERLGRKDWLNIAYSTFVSTAVNLALTPERAQGLLQLAGVLLKSLWDKAHLLIT
jgi:hypothetical protein